MEELSPLKKFLYELQQDWGKGDLYRDTPIRFLGYTNEVGEAFRAWVPNSFVKLTYVIASGYVLADGFDKSHKVYKKPFECRAERQKQVGITLLDTLTWQAFASVIIPGAFINRFCAGTSFALRKFSRLAPTSVKLITTSLGLGVIPFIVKPIDSLVEVGMDHTLRQYYTVHHSKDN